jgi:hypothetical protein
MVRKEMFRSSSDAIFGFDVGLEALDKTMG